MWTWLNENSSMIQAAGGIVTALVWIVFLQILVSNFRRQRRSEILIYTGGNRANPRIFVSNLGFENIYVLEIMITPKFPEGRREASVIDRREIDERDLTSPSDFTLQGPLGSGEYVNIGSPDDLLNRARDSDCDAPVGEQIERFEIRVAALTAATSSVVAARRRRVERKLKEKLTR